MNDTTIQLGPAYNLASDQPSFVLRKVEVSLKVEGSILLGEGRIQLDILPRPNIHYYGTFLSVPDEVAITLLFEDPEIFFLADNNDVKGSCIKMTQNLISREGEGVDINIQWKPESDVIINNADGHAAMSRADFHLFNFLDISDSVGRIAPHKGINFNTIKWTFNIAPLIRTSNSIKRLTAEGGYQLTHIGSIQRSNGSKFSMKELKDCSQALRSILSFAKGGRCDPVCIIGYDTGDVDEDPIIEWLSSPRESWYGAFNWLDYRNVSQLINLFPCFMAKWEIDDWREALYKAIHWYVSVNSSPLDTDGGIILAQSAIELLSYGYVVKEKCLLTAEGFRGLRPSSNKMRILFSSLNIPLDIPDETPALRELTKNGKKLLDAPHALTEVRNSLAHPDHKHYSQHKRVYNEAWNLSLWYLEMSILAICGYEGTYNNRLMAGPAKSIHKVPWSIE